MAPLALPLLATLAIALVAWLALAGSGRARVAGAALLVLALVGSLAARIAGQRPDPAPVTNRTVEVARDGYVSSDACRACHPSHYESWHASYHRTMTQVATPQSIAGDFDTTVRLGAATYRLERRGDESWVRVEDAPGGETEPREVVLLTGSHHRQWLWFPTGEGRRLGAAPFIWLKDERRWIPREAGFMLAPELGWSHSYHEGGWGAGCVSCHTTHGEMTGPFNPEARTVEFGIACESCHGPAAQHVRRNRMPQERYGSYLSGDADPSIVNPERLSHRRSAEVCGQCHSVSLMPSLTVKDPERYEARHDYRPGDDLSGIVGDVRIAEHLADATRWPDGMSRSGGREYDALVATPCFQRGKMSCLSCHRLHRAGDDPRPLGEWAVDQLESGMRGDAACLQCHESRLAEHEHTRHEPGSTGGSCYNCHMPYTSYALLKAIRNHDVRGPTVAESLEAGRPNACNLCHLDKSLGWTARYLQEWYDVPTPGLRPEEQEVSAAVLWLLRGYAGQRGLVAWHMGWPPAQQASGREWLAAYLAQLLDDPYAAVRIMAARSLRSLPGFEDFRYDYTGSAAEMQAAREKAVELWQRRVRAAVAAEDPALTDPAFALSAEEFARLLAERDRRRISWLE